MCPLNNGLSLYKCWMLVLLNSKSRKIPMLSDFAAVWGWITYCHIGTIRRNESQSNRPRYWVWKWPIADFWPIFLFVVKITTAGSCCEKNDNNKAIWFDCQTVMLLALKRSQDDVNNNPASEGLDTAQLITLYYIKIPTCTRLTFIRLLLCHFRMNELGPMCHDINPIIIL